MVAGSILPVAFYKDRLYFLFGKENPLEDSHKGWSDFGGGTENKETPYLTAIREGSEELTGFLGNIEPRIKKGGLYKIVHNDYHVHIFLMDFDENLPVYYNNNHSFLWKRIDHTILNKTKLFEKIEIRWFSEKMMRTNRSEFREFYREIVDKIINEIPEITKKMRFKKKRFIKSTQSRKYTPRKLQPKLRQKTRKIRGGK